MAELKKLAPRHHQRKDLIESARQIVDYNQIAREYLGKIMENGQRFSTDRYTPNIIAITSEDKNRGYVIVNTPRHYNEKAATLMTALESGEIVREFVDHEKHLAGFSWRKIQW